MALPSQVPSPMMQAPPGQQPPGAGPSPMGVPGLAQLAQRGQGGMPPTMEKFLIFMAGVGFPEFARMMEKMRNPEGKKTALGKEAAANPMMNNPAAAAAAAKLAAMQAAARGGAPSGAPMGQPAPNPMSMFMR